MAIINDITLYLPSHPTKIYPKRDLSQIDTIVVHQTDSKDKGTFHPYDTARHHINSRGWAGIGYHYFIIKDGTIYQTQPDYVISNHASSYNDNSLGVVITGDHRLPTSKDYTCGDNEAMLGKTQYKSLVWTISHLQLKHNLSLDNIVAHGQTGIIKSCPNLNMEQLKTDVKKKKIFQLIQKGVLVILLIAFLIYLGKNWK